MTQGAGIRSIAQNSLYLLGSEATERVLRLLYALVLARELGLVGYGMYGYGVSLGLAVIPLTGLGLEMIMGREIGLRGEGAGRTVRVAFTLRLLTSLVASLAVCGVALASESSPESAWVISIFAAGVMGRALADWARASLVALERASAWWRIGTSFRLLEVAVGTTILWNGGGLVAVAVLYSATWWFIAAVGLRVVSARYIPIRLEFHRGEVRHLVAAGGWLTGAGGTSAWIRHGVVLLVRWVGGAEALGIITLVMQLATVALAPFVALANAAVPVLSRSVQRGDGQDILFLDAVFRLAVLVLGTGWILAAAVGPAVVPPLFGIDFAATGNLLGPALGAMVPAAWSILIVRHAVARSASRALFFTGLLGATAFTVAGCLLIPRYGALGALVAYSLGTLITGLAPLRTLPAAAVGRLLATCALGVLCVGLAVFSQRFIPYQWLVTPGSLCLLLFGAMLTRLLSLQQIRRLMSTLRGRQRDEER